MGPELNGEQRRELLQLLYEFGDVLASSLVDIKLPAIAPPFEIQTTGGPFKQGFYRLAPDDT